MRLLLYRGDNSPAFIRGISTAILLRSVRPPVCSPEHVVVVEVLDPRARRNLGVVLVRARFLLVLAILLVAAFTHGAVLKIHGQAVAGYFVGC